MATNFTYNGNQVATINDIDQSLNTFNDVSFNKVSTGTIVKTGGTNIQYLMADGSSLTQSANSGNSNFYLYNNTALQTIPASGTITYNNTNPLLATIVRISNITRDDIDIIVFFKQINQLNDLYIQDQASSLNFIKYNITETPITFATYIEIPVIHTSSSGSFDSTLVMVSFFTNNLEIDTRLFNVETIANNALPKAGGTMTGNITLGTNNIIGTTGLIQGFNIPTLNTNITTLQTNDLSQGVYILKTEIIKTTKMKQNH